MPYQRDDRRRRVLYDTQAKTAAPTASGPLSAAEGTPVAGTTSAPKSAAYGEATFLTTQSRITDLIPRRIAVHLLLLALGIAAVAMLEGMYAWMPRLSAGATDGRIAALDLDGEGSLAVWFSSMTLTLCAAVALIVYSVRRHRKDDYQGHYRIWLWAALCWAVMSLDETASLHEGFKEMMTQLSGQRPGLDGSEWWVAGYFFVLTAIGSRLFLDMRECWTSTLAILGTAGCYVVAVATQLGWVMPEMGARGVMVEEGAEMIGNLLLLAAMMLHARHVVLDAEGRLPHRIQKVYVPVETVVVQEPAKPTPPKTKPRREKKWTNKKTSPPAWQDTLSALAEPKPTNEEAAEEGDDEYEWEEVAEDEEEDDSEYEYEYEEVEEEPEEEPVARKRPKRSKRTPHKKIVVHPPHGVPQPTSRKKSNARAKSKTTAASRKPTAKAKKAVADQSADDIFNALNIEEPAPSGPRKLTKAERKAIRRKMQKESRKRQE